MSAERKRYNNDTIDNTIRSTVNVFSVDTNPKRPDLSLAQTKEELVDLLITGSDPEGPNFERLKEIKMWLEERVMLSQVDERFLDELVDVMNGPKCCHYYRRIKHRCARSRSSPCPYNDWKKASRKCIEYVPGKATERERKRPIQ